VPLYRLADDAPQLTDAVMIASLDGWVDAAEAGSEAVAHIARECRVVASFDPDAIFDYRSRRPVLDVLDGRLTDLRWPELTVRHTAAGGRDLLILSGAEPDLRWQELATDMVELARRLSVGQWISLGAVPGAVAHTMPVPVMATASEDGLLTEGTVGPDGLLRVPAAALSAFEMAVSGAGIPAVGFFAQVPPYASIGYAAASIALLERLGEHLGVELGSDDLVEAEREQRARYDDAVAGDAMLRQTVEQLESAGDDADEEERLPSGDELAREIERFLRGQGEGDEP
jgi:hypothetical protein